MYSLSKRSLSRLEGIQPILIDILIEAIKESPYDFGIPQFGGLRTAEDQNMLYQKGRDLPGRIVTNVDGYNKLSNHQAPKGEEYGEAFDIYAYVNRKASWKTEHLEAIAEHIKKVALEKFDVKLTWGGDWTGFRDMPHFQL
jgi:peptidoglycan L-alanyl-D-glutamate endopeptidase CwlK